MFCPKCAAQNLDDAKFCRACGADISLVPQAVSGELAERLGDAEGAKSVGHHHRRGKGPATIDKAVRSFFMGLAFIFVALAVKVWAPGGFTWWFWMLIPAFGLVGDGVATYIRARQDAERLAPPPFAPAQTPLQPPQRVSALPPRETGEIVPPPSVTEATTRHLGIPVERKPKDV